MKYLDSKVISEEITLSTTYLHLVAIDNNETAVDTLFKIYTNPSIDIKNNFNKYYEVENSTTDSIEYTIIPYVDCMITYLVGEEA